MGLLQNLSRLLGGEKSTLEIGEIATGSASATFPALSTQLLAKKPSEARENSESYLEIVVTREQLPTFEETLAETLGPPAKPFEDSVRLGARIRALIDEHGGVRKDQCLYLQGYEDQSAAFALLWPWAGGDSITLKLGILDLRTR